MPPRPIRGKTGPRPLTARAKVTIVTFASAFALICFQQSYFRHVNDIGSSATNALAAGGLLLHDDDTWGLSKSTRRTLSATVEDGLVSIPSSLPEAELPQCQRDPMQRKCFPADFSVLAEGGLEARLQAVCAAHAVRSATNFSARAVWVQDQTHMPRTSFTDLFQPLEWVQDSEATAGQWMHRLRPTFRTLALPACGKGESHAAVYFDAFLSPSNINFFEFEAELRCSLSAHYRSCFALLEPSAAVQALVDAEPHRDRLRKSVSVFIDEIDPRGACAGCTGTDAAPDVCMVRRLTRHYLRDPSMDFTVGSLAAADAVNAASYFHPLRAPLLLQATKNRATRCPFSPPFGAEITEEASAVRSIGAPPTLTWRRRRLMSSGDAAGEKMGSGVLMEKENEMRPLAESENMGSGVTEAKADVEEGSGLQVAKAKERKPLAERADEGTRLAEQLAASAKRTVRGSPVGFFEIDEAKRQAVAKAAAEAEREGSQASDLIKVVLSTKVSREDMMQCVRWQAAELFLLSEAVGLIPTNQSSASSLFLTAKGPLRTPTFHVKPSVCKQAPIRPLPRQKFAMFVAIEEELKLVYCAIPKVAVTSWLMWLRAQLGLKDPKNPWLALHEYDSGLHSLAIHFTERQAVRLITRPDFFKFTFVRNPFSRVASAYSNKLVKSDTPGKKTGPGSRSYWNWAFFRNVQQLFDAVKDEEDLVSFRDFIKLVEALSERFRWKMDRHIAPEVDICNLNGIKYDFVGRFERLQEDVQKVVDRYGGQHMDIFNFGRNAHYTNATGRLARMYDQDSYNAVKRIYAPDFFVALNNITYEPPEVLQKLFE